jgi:hypothetical protein
MPHRPPSTLPAWRHTPPHPYSRVSPMVPKPPPRRVAKNGPAGHPTGPSGSRCQPGSVTATLMPTRVTCRSPEWNRMVRLPVFCAPARSFLRDAEHAGSLGQGKPSAAVYRAVYHGHHGRRMGTRGASAGRGRSGLI